MTAPTLDETRVMMHHWQGWLYVVAVLIPLGAFAIEAVFGRWLGRLNAYLATAAIACSFGLSATGFVVALPEMLSHHHAEPEDASPGSREVTSGTVPHTHESTELPASTPESESAHAGLPWTGQWDWITLDPSQGEGRRLAIPIGIYIDSLAIIMFLMVSFVATLIHIYSIGYMAGDVRYPRFFTYLSLFCFSMLALVASNNVFTVFMCWELVGVCSYLLIGFWYEEKTNSDAANKAFIVNRIGDVGMLVGLGVLWTTLGTFNIADINHGLSEERLREAPTGRITRLTAGDTIDITVPDSSATGDTAPQNTYQVPYWLLTLAGLGIFAGCVGKSAQFPLHVWLPDAMAGPTPVSALIHAATMVAAGVYLVGRFFPLFNHEVLLVIGYAGGITLFLAASIALVQTDYKKVLAYSTVSQLGYMMLGLGVGGWSAGLFHLLTHAFFKALLFLGAGSVYHSVHTYEMPALGGLLKKMPITAYTMLAATLAISGVPFFSGFYSKDAILGSALFFSMAHPSHWLLFLLPTVGAAMTSFYMFRLWFLVFDGEPRGFPAPAVAEVEHADDHNHAHSHHHSHRNPVEHAHESPGVMTWPLILLAIPAVVVGYPAFLLPISEPILEQMLAQSAPLRTFELGSAHWWAMGASIILAAAGIGGALGYYSRWRIFDPRLLAERFGGVYDFLYHKWYFDEVYNALLVRPTLALARLAAAFDRWIIDGAVNGTASLTVLLSRFEGFFDLVAVDQLVNLTGRVIYTLGNWGREIQTGRLRSYLMVLTVGVVILFAGVYFWVVRFTG